jgi:hydrogenase maturation protease
MRTLVLGLGNPILRDDSVGLRVVQALAPHVAQSPDIEICEDYWGGLRLMERMIGYDRAVVVDAIRTGAQPGDILILSPDDLPTQRSASIHDMNLSTALQLGHLAGVQLPAKDQITLIGIEAEDVLTFDDHLTPQVEAAIPKAVESVLSRLDLEQGAP